MAPGPVITPGMRTTAFLSADGEGDCCAATGTPAAKDVTTHTPVATSALLIQFVICAYPHPKDSPERYQLASRHRLRLMVTHGSSPMLTWIKDDIEARVPDKARKEQPGRSRREGSCC